MIIPCNLIQYIEPLPPVQVKYTYPLPDTGQRYSEEAFARYREVIEVMIRCLCTLGGLSLVQWPLFSSNRCGTGLGPGMRADTPSAKPGLHKPSSRPLDFNFSGGDPSPPLPQRRYPFFRIKSKSSDPKGQLIGVVYQDAHLTHPEILIGSEAIDHVQHQRRRSRSW